MRRLPDNRSGLRIEREQSAASFRVEQQRHAEHRRLPAARAWRWWGHRDVGERHVNVRAVERRSPLHAADTATLSELGLPENFAGLRVQRMDNARFLTGDEV